MKNFALVGASGYIAPRHMKAIKDTKNNLLVAVDTSDSVGIIDSYFPDASFFTVFERFDRHIEKLKYEKDTLIDYFSICSPNFLHDAHIRFALRSGANAICEKPLVVNIKNLDKLLRVEESTGKKIFAILQLREHESIINLKQKIDLSKNQIYDVELTYITSRGKWYDYSWKGDIEKSGGITTNIGIHFFDMLIWIFGDAESVKVHQNTNKISSGFLRLKNANVKWFLSTDSKYIPNKSKINSMSTYRSIKINNEEFEFSKGFTDLHTSLYKSIIAGKGFGALDAYKSIEIVNKIRFMTESPLSEEYHPFNKQ